MRLGVLGGTFDPVHLGHLRLAEEVGEGLDLEKVYLIPAASPPHKNKRPVTPFHDRFRMTQIAVKASPLLDVLDLEGRRPGHSYSIETFRELHRIFTPDLELHFILGMDAFLEIKTWKEYKKLFDYAHFVVINRPGIPVDTLDHFLADLGVGFKQLEGTGKFVVPSGNTLIYMESTMMEISSTGIRTRVANGKSIRFLVPEAVRVQIIEKGLYAAHEDT